MAQAFVRPLVRSTLCAALLVALPLAASAQSRIPLGRGRDRDASTDSLVALAQAQLGRQYRWGGDRPESGFDCSGFTRYVLAAFGIGLPRTADEQARTGQEIRRDVAALRPGDLLTFGDGRRVSHVGIYIGEGRFIHASTSQRRIAESSLLRESNLVRAWRGVRRVVAARDSSKKVAEPILARTPG